MHFRSCTDDNRSSNNDGGDGSSGHSDDDDEDWILYAVAPSLVETAISVYFFCVQRTMERIGAQITKRTDVDESIDTQVHIPGKQTLHCKL